MKHAARKATRKRRHLLGLGLAALLLHPLAARADFKVARPPPVDTPGKTERAAPAAAAPRPQAPPRVRAAAAAEKQVAPGRCRELLSRVSIGDTLSPAESSFLKQECK